jgi:8-amino-7-oxononanoate synthase
VTWLDDELRQADEKALLRRPLRLHYQTSTRALLDSRPVVVFCTNDYLGLRHHPDLAAAATRAVTEHGTGTGASRLVSGNLDLHDQAEAALADLVGRPAALLVSSGFAANAGALPSLLGPDDVVFSDALNHASTVDGCRLSRARVVIVPHADPDALAREVARHRPFRRGWVVTESLFSMDGDLAPLPAIRALCDREGLYLYVDDAHALGVFGDRGEGACGALGIATDVLVGTLGKALGTAGAFLAGSESLRLYLWNRCRSFVFSTGVAPPVAAAALEAARLVQRQPQLRATLQRNIAHLRSALARRGLPTAGHPAAPILPLVLGEETRALALSARLQDDGFFVQAIRPPTVPRGTARLRITVSAAHTPEEIDGLVDALARHAP